MSTLAQEEADRFFSRRERQTSHPEDLLDHDDVSSDYSSSNPQQENSGYYVNSEEDIDDDGETLHTMTTNKKTTATTYRLPTRHFNANTGPKGVISDAHSFNRAKKSIFRSTLAALTNGTFSNASRQCAILESNEENDISDDSDGELGASSEEDFMKRWREKRLKELASRSSAAQRRKSPSKRVWGTFDDVDADGYLDAVEKVPDDAVVVVCIYDPLSNASAAVEDSLTKIAQKHVTTRFVKLDHDIAEMEHIDVPAILAYRAGDVFATLSDCRPDGLETTLRRNGILG